MLVERRQRGKGRNLEARKNGDIGNGTGRSSFSTLSVKTGDSNLEITAMDRGEQSFQIGRRDFRKSNLSRVDSAGQKEIVVGKKVTAKKLGKGVVIGNRPKVNSGVLKPINSNVRSSTIIGRGSDVVGSRKSHFAQKSMDNNFNFIPVNFQSNLDRNKHATVCLEEKGE